MGKLSFCSIMENPFYCKELNIGIDLREAGMVHVERSNFAANLFKSMTTITNLKAVDVTEKKAGVGGRTRLKLVASREGGCNRKIRVRRVVEQLRMSRGLMEYWKIRCGRQGADYGVWRIEGEGRDAGAPASVSMPSVVRETLLNRGLCLLGERSLIDLFWSKASTSSASDA